MMESLAKERKLIAECLGFTIVLQGIYDTGDTCTISSTVPNAREASKSGGIARKQWEMDGRNPWVLKWFYSITSF